MQNANFKEKTHSFFNFQFDICNLQYFFSRFFKRFKLLQGSLFSSGIVGSNFKPADGLSLGNCHSHLDRMVQVVVNKGNRPVRLFDAIHRHPVLAIPVGVWMRAMW